MSSQANSGPTPAIPSGGVQLPPTPEKLQRCFDHGIWYALSLWPALHVATSNSWGGPDSADKRDWFAGAVSDLFTSRPDTNPEEVEVFLLQIMQDEFDCNVEDDSEVEVARTIIRLKLSLREDKSLEAFRELEQRWKSRGQMKMNVQVIDNEAEGDDEEWEGLDDEEDPGMDIDSAHDTVPDLVSALPKQKAEPEVDEEGFTKVAGKKKR